MKAPSDLGIDVLGTSFALRWGPAVTSAQRQSMTLAWSRCLSDSSVIAPQTVPGDPDLPFTASVRYESKLPGESVRHLGSDTFEGLAEAVTSEVTVAAILESAGELTMLHACGVADEEGLVVALVAKSGTGKTTASSQLARTFGYGFICHPGRY